MKKALFSLALMISCLQLVAQQDYFVFIQDGTRQPFYARISDKTYSSSAIGHLIIPALKDSLYQIYIGFPRNQSPEQLFCIAVNKKDRGFELKKTDGRGFQLFDLQGLQFLQPAPASAGTGGVNSGEKKTDSYSRLMAGVVDDSAVLYGSAVKVEPVAKALAPDLGNPDVLGKSAGGSLKVNQVVNKALESGKDHNAAAGKPVAAVKPATPVLSGASEEMKVAAINESKPQEIVETTSATNEKIKALLPAETNPSIAIKATSAEKAGDKKTVTTEPPASLSPEAGVSGQETTPATKPKAVAITKVKPDITRFSSEVLTASRRYTYIDRTGGTADTIVLVIQRDGIVIPITEENQLAKLETDARAGVRTSPVTTAKLPQVLPTVEANEVILTEPGPKPAAPSSPSTQPKPFVSEEIKISPDSAMTTVVGGDSPVLGAPLKTGVADTPFASAVMNADCVKFAGDIDVDKLRIVIMGEKTIDEKALAAKNTFRTKCFSTRQIRALSELFTGDMGKYQLLDAAYAFVSDQGNFKNLASLLKEEYYLNRFKAMLKR